MAVVQWERSHTVEVVYSCQVIRCAQLSAPLATATIPPLSLSPGVESLMESYSSSPRHLLRSLTDNFSLIERMARREVLARYRGSLIGLAWSFFNPILLLLVYTFVFTVVFKARWGESRFADEAASNPAIMIFAGMIVHGLFSESFVRSPTLITGNANYVKRVVFPLEILPWISMGAALFHSLISLLVLLAAQLVMFGQLPWTALLIPIAWLPLVLFTLGFCWFFSAAGVYFRDLAQVSTLLSMVLLFLSPVFYPITIIPEAYRAFFYLNPLTYGIEASRALLIFGELPNPEALGLYYLASAVTAILGFAWFQKTRRGFADVL